MDPATLETQSQLRRANGCGNVKTATSPLWSAIIDRYFQLSLLERERGISQVLRPGASRLGLKRVRATRSAP